MICAIKLRAMEAIGRCSSDPLEMPSFSCRCAKPKDELTHDSFGTGVLFCLVQWERWALIDVAEVSSIVPDSRCAAVSNLASGGAFSTN